MNLGWKQHFCAVDPLDADGDEVADGFWLETNRRALTVTKLLMDLGWKQHFRAVDPMDTDGDEIADESWLETTLREQSVFVRWR